MADAIKLDLDNTPEKFRPTVDEILSQLMKFLEELCRLEDQYFVQKKRLRQKGRVISFKDFMVRIIHLFSTVCILAVPLYLP